MKKHTLTIMRHAKSDWDGDERTDFERPLSGRGERDARRMGKWLSEQSFTPEVILSSPAVRAAQTARSVAHELGGTRIRFVESLYLADLGDLLEVLAHPPARTWMLVGHNPGLEQLVTFCDPDVGEKPEFRKLMPTAAIYAVDITGGNEAPAAGCGRVRVHQRPKLLD